MSNRDFLTGEPPIDLDAPPLQPVFLLTDWRTIDAQDSPVDPAPGAFVKGTLVGEHPDHPEGARITTGTLIRWNGPIATCQDGSYHLDASPSQIHLNHIGLESVTAEEPLGPMPGQTSDAVEQ
jgi:hypothetical protein